MISIVAGSPRPWQRSFGRCDSDDSLDTDNGNGRAVVLYTKLQAASLAPCLSWALHQVRGMHEATAAAAAVCLCFFFN